MSFKLLVATVPLRQLEKLLFCLRLLWGFVESDFLTFAVPNTVFGFFSSLAPLLLHVETSAAPLSMPYLSISQLLRRLPHILAFNTANLLIFDLANQRSPTAVAEDRLNKPWRPIPQGSITSEQTRRLLLALLPATLALNYALGVWHQGLLIQLLTWAYNDLGGGDEAFVREVLIAVAYGLFNSASLTVALAPGAVAAGGAGDGGGPARLSARGVAWTALVSGVILTTMQVQDLKDRAGDRARGRRTVVLVLGEAASRASIAGFVCFWSWASLAFWDLGAVACLGQALLVANVVLRVLFVRSSRTGDAWTWRWWCVWHASLYVLPVVKRSELFG